MVSMKNKKNYHQILSLIQSSMSNCHLFVFQEYVLRIDPVTNLGLSAESVFSYHIGDIVRTKGKMLTKLTDDRK